MTQVARAEAVSFTPEVQVADPLAAWWLRQATLRLRREICWRWHQQEGEPPGDVTRLPSPIDPLSESLDLARYADGKQRFFASDVTARYLSQQLRTPGPLVTTPQRGSFAWLVEVLELDEPACFLLALALLPVLDNAVGPVIASCQGRAGAQRPSLGLAQKLWDRPEALLGLDDSEHPLTRSGILTFEAYGDVGASQWDAGLSVAALVARQLCLPEDEPPARLSPLDPALEPRALDTVSLRIAEQLRPTPERQARFVPLTGQRDAAFAETALALSVIAGRSLRQIGAGELDSERPARLRAVGTLAWLHGVDLFFGSESLALGKDSGARLAGLVTAFRLLPITVYLSIEDRAELAALPRDLRFPAVEVPSLDHAARVALWQERLGAQAERLEPAIAECARRYRFESGTIAAICSRAETGGIALDGESLTTLCRAEMALDVGGLAQPVTPRFTEEELILPPAQRRQLEEIYRAMTALTEVHYGWGTARAWNESGLSVLFAGPPGTGKTMAAEVLAAKLDLPLYRIDLSQVVSKYIGETEKNLKQLFDSADIADTILFFDEADSLFGRRTEVKDAHDRYANLEISYLLERMERFKGLAILATNRRKDLDEAFLRRLREIVEFPMPSQAERKAIWQGMVPDAVDGSALDFDFLAARFALAGGHIRSIVFNACLQSAECADRRLTMEPVLIAVKREYDKMNRSVSLEQFGRYAPLVEALKRG